MIFRARFVSCFSSTGSRPSSSNDRFDHREAGSTIFNPKPRLSVSTKAGGTVGLRASFLRRAGSGLLGALWIWLWPLIFDGLLNFAFATVSLSSTDSLRDILLQEFDPCILGVSDRADSSLSNVGFDGVLVSIGFDV